MSIEYNKKSIQEKFGHGRQLLDSNKFEEAINVFSELIAISEQNIDNPDAQVTLETSLNNRGVAQSRWTEGSDNRELFLKGIDDYKRAVEEAEESDKSGLTAFGNLRIAEKELVDFGKTGKNINADYKIQNIN